MPVVGSRQVQVCKRQRDEAERKRCESHNPSGTRPALVLLSLPSASPLLLSQAARRSQHPSGQRDLFKFPVTLIIRATFERLRVLQLKSHRDETHLGTFTLATSIWTSFSRARCALSSRTFCLASLLLIRATKHRLLVMIRQR